MRSVDVIVPIYNAGDMVRAALEALQRTLSSEDSVILIDDASTEVDMPSIIESFQRNAQCAVRLERNEQNLGFVKTVNRAMQLSKLDVVLLNSDTTVTQGWLQRLIEAADSDPQIATVTPFSNNAEICSYPVFCSNNPALTNAEPLAQVMARRAGDYPDLPTAVGFCMFIRRRALDQLGDFDAATFGRGYGEENDFCLRASAHGWRHVLCDRAYVTHHGGASFGLTGEKSGGEALKRLSARYPGYNALIADYVRNDPLAPIREQIQSRMRALETDRSS